MLKRVDWYFLFAHNLEVIIAAVLWITWRMNPSLPSRSWSSSEHPHRRPPPLSCEYIFGHTVADCERTSTKRTQKKKVCSIPCVTMTERRWTSGRHSSATRAVGPNPHPLWPIDLFLLVPLSFFFLFSNVGRHPFFCFWTGYGNKQVNNHPWLVHLHHFSLPCSPCRLSGEGSGSKRKRKKYESCLTSFYFPLSDSITLPRS